MRKRQKFLLHHKNIECTFEKLLNNTKGSKIVLATNMFIFVIFKNVTIHCIDNIVLVT